MTDTLSDARRPRDALKTRDSILDAAQALILDHGYGATTVDAVVARAGITKGAFFHHFVSKAQLARALVERYAALDREHLGKRLERARKLATDPLQRLLLLVSLYEEDFESLEEPFPGCLFASYVYENKLFDDAVLEVLRESALWWRAQIRMLLDEVVAVDIESLADLFYALPEGAFVMTQTLADRTLLPKQVRHLRTYHELLFAR